MPSTQIWADTLRSGVCRERSCRKHIWFAINVKTGKYMPFSGRPTPQMVQPELGTQRELWTVDLAQSHFVDCPGRAKFRRPR